MSVKKRVFQVAREFNISNEALIAYLTKLNFDIRNQMSVVSEDAYALTLEKFGEKPAEVDKDYEFRRRLREKKASEEAKKAEAREDLARRLQVARDLAREVPTLRKQRLATKEEAEAAEAERMKAKAAEKPPAMLPSEEKAKVAKKEPTVKPRKKLIVIEIPPEELARRPRERDRAAAKPSAEVEIEKPLAEPGKKTIELDKVKAIEEEEARAKKKRRKRKRKKKTAEVGAEVKPAETAEKKRKKSKKKKKITFNEEEIQETIRQTLAAIEDTGKARRKKKRVLAEEEEEVDERSVIKVSEFMSISELARLMDAEPTDLIRKCMELGMMVSINQRLDMDTITLLASEYGFDVEPLAEFGDDVLEILEVEEEDDGKQVRRPPVVTIMGHVDHGKTSLLDHIRKSNIIAGEAGGITQHIGAYEVVTDSKAITFLDTPGHEAFTAMRARGAQVTDIVILVVAADDNVMPQTIEAISHAKAANVPIIVAINKIDKPGANPDNIRTQLANHGVLVEQWGGKYQSVEISAKTGQNIDQLLEMIVLEAELLDLKANPERLAKGAIVESRLDKGKGVVATVLVQNGTLKIGDPFVAGPYSGKVRSMFDDHGRRVKKAGPSMPIQVLGFDGMPQAGDSIIVLSTERDTKDISLKRQQLQREHERWRSHPRTLDEISRQIQKGQIKQLKVVLKADVDGSIEAITDTLGNLKTEEVAVDIIHKGVGAISESDVLLGSASGAIVIGFNVRPTIKARELAAKESVDIRLYEVIYDIVNEIKAALEGFLAPQITEELTGTAEVRQVFKVPKVGIIAGCYLSSGKINRNDKVKLYRDDRLIHDGQIQSLKRFKEDVREVAAGFECGIGLLNYDDIKVNDIIEAYKTVETKRTLD
ncbi:translation initiation factor IF-2 [candidate division KSB1 bacterium]|nr:translation initiation factor IF-2 [candidate division KSB1 bacterium]